MLRLSTAIALAGSMAPLGAQGQEPTPLPEVDVIAPGPLPSTRRLPPKRVRAAPSSASTRAPAQAPQTTVATDPGVIERDKVPANTQVLTPADFSHTQSSNILDSLAKGLAGASLSDQSGNAFQRNLDYRGFTASPVPGTPQGLAVYQNGVRINESFGDVVNWDFIPEMAINRASLVPNNPRAQPFPTPPPEVSGTEIKFTVPVRYGIR
jgi:iron complex outermembrane receptor protein